MSDANDNLGLGGGLPPLNPLGGPSLDEEEKALRSGRGRMMAVMIAIPIVLAAVAIAYVMMTGGDEQYRTLGRNINGLREQHFDGFWTCTLDGADLRAIDNNNDLEAQIHLRAGSARRAAWAGHVRDECMPKLEELEPEIAILIPPEEMASRLEELESATSALRGAWSGFIAYLLDLRDAAYDEGDARTHVMAIARAWYDYRRIHGELNAAVRERLQE